jgi:hypothetical protein
VTVELEDVREAARKVFRQWQAVDAFVELRTPKLGGRTPRELVEEGRGSEVLEFIEQLAREAPAPPPSIFGFPLSRVFRK